MIGAPSNKFGKITAFRDVLRCDILTDRLTDDQSRNVLEAWFKFQHNSNMFQMCFKSKVSEFIDWSVLGEVLEVTLGKASDSRKAQLKFWKAFETLWRLVGPEAIGDGCVELLRDHALEELSECMLLPAPYDSFQKRSFLKNRRTVPYPKTHHRLRHRRMLEHTLNFTRCPVAFSSSMSPILLLAPSTGKGFSTDLYVHNHTKIKNLIYSVDYCSSCHLRYHCDFHAKPAVLIPVPDPNFWSSLRSDILQVMDRLTFDGYNRIEALFFLKKFVFSGEIPVVFYPKGCTSRNIFRRLQDLTAGHQCVPVFNDQKRIWSQLCVPDPTAPEMCMFANVQFGTDSSFLHPSLKEVRYQLGDVFSTENCEERR